jgi:acetylornithine deacetylase
MLILLKSDSLLLIDKIGVFSKEALAGQPAQSFESTATTDLRSFVHYGQGQATWLGPVAENIHAENERVNIESVIHTAKAYALFLARWCGLVE